MFGRKRKLQDASQLNHRRSMATRGSYGPTIAVKQAQQRPAVQTAADGDFQFLLKRPEEEALAGIHEIGRFVQPGGKAHQTTLWRIDDRAPERVALHLIDFIRSGRHFQHIIPR